MKYLIDTDPGIDDALALILAIKAGLDIELITTVAGNSTLENVTKNTEFILKQLNSNIKNSSGAAGPLNKKLVQAESHGPDGLAGLCPPGRAELAGRAVEDIIDLVKENKDLTIIALGPLTNIARAIQRAPQIMSNLSHLIIMGGALKVPGNQTEFAEFNFFVDPEAIDLVSSFPINKTLIPLDVANKAVLTEDDLKKNQDYLKPFVRKITDFYIQRFGSCGATLYDPLAVYFALRPQNFTCQDYGLSIRTRGKEQGRSLIVEKDQKNIFNVAVDFDLNKFKKDFIDIVSA